MKDLKVGDPVRVYGRVDRNDMRKGEFFNGKKATVFGDVNGDGSIGILIEGYSGLSCHVNQLRRLKPRVKVWPQHGEYLHNGRQHFYMTQEDFNRLSRKQKVLLGVK